MIKEYRKKPVVIKAVKLADNPKSIKQCLEFMGQRVNLKSRISQEKFSDYCDIVSKSGLKIKTLEGTMTANIGDYIIRGVSGEFYPCKPKIFRKTYEIVK